MRARKRQIERERAGRGRSEGESWCYCSRKEKCCHVTVRCAHVPLPSVGRRRQLAYPMVNERSSSLETPARALPPSAVMTLFFGAKRIDGFSEVDP